MPRKHDHIFKHTFSNPAYAADALRGLLPAPIAAVLDWSTLEALPGTYVSKDLVARYTDQLYRVQLHAQEALLYLLWEHQGRADGLMPFRVLEYMVRIWRGVLARRPKSTRLPPIIPLVLYNGRHGWTAATCLSALYAVDAPTLELIRPWVPDATVLLHDLSKVDDAWFKAFTATVALIFGSLKHSHSKTALAAFFQSGLPLLREIDGIKAHWDALEAIFRYAISADLEPSTLRALVVDQLGPVTQEALVTAADRLISQGRAEGIKIGREEGREEGLTDGARSLLTRRFGPMDDTQHGRLNALHAAGLAVIYDEIFTAESIDEILTRAEAAEPSTNG